MLTLEEKYDICDNCPKVVEKLYKIKGERRADFVYLCMDCLKKLIEEILSARIDNIANSE